MWQYILLSISALLFFGFVALGVVKFGWLSCYSAYGPLWGGEYTPNLGQFNIWSFVTIFSALLMVPVILGSGEGNPWQFLGFLAPMCITLVGASPNYQEGGFYNVIHQIGAWGAVVFIIAYVLIIPKLFAVIFAFFVLSLLLGIVIKGTLMFWAEMAVYVSTYVILFATI